MNGGKGEGRGINEPREKKETGKRERGEDFNSVKCGINNTRNKKNTAIR